MQRDSGLHFWLNLPSVYNLFQDAIGGNALRQKFVQHHLKAKAGDKLIDIGCGPANILRWLPRVDYVGLDVNPACIASAKRMHGGRGTFVVGDTRSLWDDSRFKDADIVIGLGILHHLEDHEALNCIHFAYRALKEGGRFVCLEACWVPNQGFLSKYIMSKDRGQNIRTEQMYRQLAGDVFNRVDAWVDTSPLRIPYVIVFLECQR